mgnify:CR=1 FL=1
MSPFGSGNRCDWYDDACESAEKDAVGDPGALGVTRSSSIVVTLPFRAELYGAVGESGNDDASDAGDGGFTAAESGVEVLRDMTGDGRRLLFELLLTTESGRRPVGP